MPSLSFLSIDSGIPANRLKRLVRYGLEIDDLDFEIDAQHQKAINDLRNRRLSAYVLAYAYRCKIEESYENYARLDDLTEIANARGFGISSELSVIAWRWVENEKLPGAKKWIERATVPGKAGHDAPALERIAGWCKTLIAGAQFDRVSYNYIAVRLLASLPPDEMVDYPKKVRTTINRLKFYGHLDGWCRPEKDDAGKPCDVFFRPKFDL
jgi:hypothetical protein